MKPVIGKLRDDADKLFLLAAFALGLVIAQCLVTWYQRVDLSAPVALGQTGLAVPLPTGPGWKAPPRWRRVGPSELALVAALQQPGVRVDVQCRYRVGDEVLNSRAELIRIVEERGYTVADSGRLRIGRAQLIWVQVEPRGDPDTTFLGFATLDGALLELRVDSPDPDLARRVFTAIGENIRYRPTTVDPGLSARTAAVAGP